MKEKTRKMRFEKKGIVVVEKGKDETLDGASCCIGSIFVIIF